MHDGRGHDLGEGRHRPPDSRPSGRASARRDRQRRASRRPPISLELTNVPEAQALDILLRTVSGYLAAPRAVAVPTHRMYDRILVLPASSGAPPRAATAAAGRRHSHAAVRTAAFAPPADDDAEVAPAGRTPDRIPRS